MDHRVAAYLATFDRESATTARVLRAYPAEHSELKPSERSNSARVLAWTFVIEQRMALLALRDGRVLGSGVGAGMPDTLEEIIAQFDGARAELIDALRAATPEQVDRTVQFFGGPKTLADYPVMDFLWFMLHDQIHHRGQLSVYLRIAGGKLPSIYGPTADEPWN